MTELEFKIKPEQAFIELNKLLQILKLAQTGGHAKIMIRNEEVKVNSSIENQVRKKLIVNDIIQIENTIIVIK